LEPLAKLLSFSPKNIPTLVLYSVQNHFPYNETAGQRNIESNVFIKNMTRTWLK